MIRSFDELAVLCRARPVRRVAVVRAEDAHTLETVLRVDREGIVLPILIGRKNVILDELNKLGDNGQGFQIVEADTAENCAIAAASMIRDGKADYIMKGALETRPLMRVLVSKEAGLRGERVMSSNMLLQLPKYHKLVVLADVGLNTTPDLSIKAQILQNAAELMNRLGVSKPKAAVLAASETLNPKLKESADAAVLKQMNINGEIKNCIVEGPISFDLAMNAEASKLKGYASEVAGDADILLAPDLVCGNTLGKSLIFMGGSDVGIVLGAKVPITLLSRASDTEAKYRSVLLGALMCE